MKVVFTYKIEPISDQNHPFQLHKRIADGPTGWMPMSTYASVDDSVEILLTELFTGELSDEIYRGQPSIDSATILKKVIDGERTIALYDKTGNQAFRLEYDVPLEALVQRKAHPRLQKRSRKTGVNLG